MKLKTLILPIFVTLTFQLFGEKNIVLSGNSSGRFIQNLVNNSISMNGPLNQAFGNNGSNTAGTSYINRSISGSVAGTIFDRINAIAIQKDGKIVVGGFSSHNNGMPCYWALARFNSDGILDQGFVGGNGTLSTLPGTIYVPSLSGITDLNLIYDQITALIIQEDGKIVAAGITSLDDDSPYCFAVGRFNSNGSLDTTFVGGNGTTTKIPGTVYINNAINGHGVGNSYDQLNALALQADGKIVAAGFTLGSYGFGDNSFFALAQFNSDGSLDTTFIGGDGAVSSFPGTVYIPAGISGPEYDAIYSIALQSDGKIVAVGTNDILGNPPPLYWEFARFTTIGALDTTFIGGNGTATIIPGTVYIPQSISGQIMGDTSDHCKGVALQNDGTIFATGYSCQSNNNPFYCALASLNPNGSLNTKFVGGNGTASVLPGTLYIPVSVSGSTGAGNITDQLSTVALQNNGKIVVGGYSHQSDLHTYFFTAGRFNQNGSLDTYFIGDGLTTRTNVPGFVWVSGIINGIDDYQDYINALAIQSSGAIVGAGFATAASGTFFALAQFFNSPTFVSYQKSYTGVGAGLNS